MKFRALLLMVAALGLSFTGCKVKPPEPPPVVDETPKWMAPRTWTSSDGRTLEGALAARMGDDGILRRKADGKILRMPPRALDTANQAFLRDAIAAGVVPTTLSDVWHLRTKMVIPGGEAIVWRTDTRNAIGPRIAKFETSYWLLLTELDGSQAKWARVDMASSTKFPPDSLVPHSEFANQMNGSGQFIDQVACPRTDIYVIDARYGLPSRRLNVTRAVMGFIADGKLPMTITPEVFGLPPHIPDVWDLTVTWQREGQGTLNRVVRDEAPFAFP
jgi:hypothetical protein